MKISCQSCAAKYTIADEKVVGKVIKLKCKKCSSTIVVNGNDPGVLAQLHAQAEGGGFDDQAATQLLSSPPQMGEASPDEWTVSVTDDDQRTMTTAQILTEYAKGGLNADTYIWKDGMADWLPIQQVPDLAPLLSAAGPPPAAVSSNGGGWPDRDDAPMAAAPMAAAAAPMAAASAARKPRSGNVDLFGGGGGGLEEVGYGNNGHLNQPPPGLGDKHVGERNETSVLFSLKDLAAAEASAAHSKPERRNAFESRNDRVDDIFSLGGMSGAPMLAPPPLNAPIIEPPPPPPSVSPMAAAMPMSYAAPPQKKSPVPFIVGGVGALALVGGIIFFVMAGGDNSAKPADADKKVAEKTAESSKTADSAAPVESSAIAAATESAPAPSASSTDSAVATNDSAAPVDPKAATTGPKTALVDPKATDPKKEDPKKEDPKKEDPKKDEPKVAAGDTPFDRGAASAALSGAAGGAKGCKKADGPTGSTKVQVTFAPSGKATQATVGPPFAGTPTGSCIASAFRGLSVPPFSGAPMTVSKTVNIK